MGIVPGLLGWGLLRGISLRGIPRLLWGIPRLLWGIPRLLWGIPRLLWGVPRLLWGVPRLLWGVPRLLWGVPRLLWGVPRLRIGLLVGIVVWLLSRRLEPLRWRPWLGWVLGRRLRSVQVGRGLRGARVGLRAHVRGGRPLLLPPIHHESASNAQRCPDHQHYDAHDGAVEQPTNCQEQEGARGGDQAVDAAQDAPHYAPEEVPHAGDDLGGQGDGACDQLQPQPTEPKADKPQDEEQRLVLPLQIFDHLGGRLITCKRKGKRGKMTSLAHNPCSPPARGF